MFGSKWKYLQVFFGGCWHTNGGTDGSTVLQFLKVGLVDNYGIFLEHCLVMVLYYKPELNRGSYAMRLRLNFTDEYHYRALTFET